MNVPALVNWCDALWPVFRVPVSKLPSLAVAVCGAFPWFVQVTVSPTWIVIVAGENLKSTIVSAGSLAAWSTAAERPWSASGLSALGGAGACAVGTAAAVDVCETVVVELDVDVVVSPPVDVVVLALVV